MEVFNILVDLIKGIAMTSKLNVRADFELCSPHFSLNWHINIEITVYNLSHVKYYLMYFRLYLMSREFSIYLCPHWKACNDVKTKRKCLFLAIFTIFQPKLTVKSYKLLFIMCTVIYDVFKTKCNINRVINIFVDSLESL